MRTVSVSELKAHLASYLREVRRGGEVQVLDRGAPIARLVPTSPAQGRDAERWTRLVQAGILRPGTGDASSILRHAPLSLGDADLTGAIAEQREERP
jgi:prevent-host-death family protein